MALRKAEDADWERFFGKAAPRHWVGFVDDEGGTLAGIGGLFWAVDGRWWATIARAPGVRKVKTAQRAAVETLALARATGLTVHAACDETIAGARLWLARLGFDETDETIEGVRVWVLKA